MIITLFKNCTLFLFWFLAFGIMLVIDTCAIVVGCYLLKQFGEELAEAGTRHRRRKRQ